MLSRSQGPPASVRALPTTAARYLLARVNFEEFLAVRDVASIGWPAARGLPCLVKWTAHLGLAQFCQFLSSLSTAHSQVTSQLSDVAAAGRRYARWNATFKQRLSHRSRQSQRARSPGTELHRSLPSLDPPPSPTATVSSRDW